MSSPAVLVIAGTDSSGGAGLIRDVHTLRAFGVLATCAVTAVTAQSHANVHASRCMPADLVCAQIAAALQSQDIRAIKIGMLGTADIVHAVTLALSQASGIPCVLDPVLASSSGGELLDAAGRHALLTGLLPRATLVTPNLLEAAQLLSTSPATTDAEAICQAQQLQRLGAHAVLIKGGHAHTATAIDWLVQADGTATPIAAPRLPTHLRGTGCALSSAIAASLAQGNSVADACRRAKYHVHLRLRAEGTAP